MSNTAQEILDAVGGPGNITHFTHCATRLRFELRDASVVDKDTVEAIDGVTGRYPKFEDFNLDGLDIDETVWAKLFAIDPDAWAAEMDDTEEYFSQFGDKLPAAITEQLAKFRARIAAAKQA